MLKSGCKLHLLAVMLMTAAAFGMYSLSASALVATEWRLESRVSEGPLHDETRRLQGIAIDLYDSNNPYPEMGDFLRSTQTDSRGWYGLPVYETDGPYDF